MSEKRPQGKNPVPPADPAATALPTLPLSLPFRSGGLSSRKPTRFDLTPDAKVRAQLATLLDLLSLPKMRFTGEIRPAGGRDFVLEAELSATVVQPCGITLEPVTTVLQDRVLRHYLADMPEPKADEVEIPEDDSAEALPDVIDAGAVATEALALALPLYPRAPGAALGAIAAAPQGIAPLRDDDLKPFAGLAALKARLEDGSGQA